MAGGILKPGVYWNVRVQEKMIIVIAELIDPDRRQAFWQVLKMDLMTYQSPSDLLEIFDRLGYPLDELKLIQELLKNYTWEDDDDGVLIPWLAFDVFPQLQASRDRFRTLETTIGMVSRRLSSFSQDLEMELASEDPDVETEDYDKMQAQCLRAVLRQHTDATAHDCDTNTSQSTSTTGGTPGSLDTNDRYKALTERIKALEEKVQDNRDNTRSHQPFVMVEGSAKTAHGQTMQSVAQEPPLDFAAVSDGSTFSTCTLTPASTVVNETVGQSNDMGRDDVVPTAPLELHIAVYPDVVHVAADRITQAGVSWPSLVRMHSNTPFKSLTDKLRQQYGRDHMYLRQKHSPLKCVFDSDTPASLNLTQDMELIYGPINGAVETIDLTMS
ncbi:hypothetical protein KCU71_g8576, partial [Aureobasidium melanogenum]